MQCSYKKHENFFFFFTMIALIFIPLHFTLWQYAPLCRPHLLHLDVPITSSLEFGSRQPHCGHRRTCLIGSVKPDACSVVGENQGPGNPGTLGRFVSLLWWYHHSLPGDLRSYQPLSWRWHSVQKQLSRANLSPNATALLICKLHW